MMNLLVANTSWCTVWQLKDQFKRPYVQDCVHQVAQGNYATTYFKANTMCNCVACSYHYLQREFSYAQVTIKAAVGNMKKVMCVISP